MKKVNIFGKLGLAATFAVALSVSACNNAAPEAVEEEITEESAKTEEHDHGHEDDTTHEEHPAGEEHPSGDSEHPN